MSQQEFYMNDENQFGRGSLPAYGKKAWVDSRERLLEWYRLYFHTIMVTLFLAANTVLAFSSAMLFIRQYNDAADGPTAFAQLFPGDPTSLASTLGTFYVPLDRWPLFWLCTIFFSYLVFCYSTISQEIKKGHKTLLSYTSKKGRKTALVFTMIHMSMLYSGLFAWYVHQFISPYFDRVRVENKPYLKITSMDGFTDFLMAMPVAISLVIAFYMAKAFYSDEDFRKTFYSWEFSFLANQSFSLRSKTCDVVVGWEEGTDKPIVLSEDSRFLHELIVGATGSGKTSTTILIRIVQDLIRIARGHKMGIVVLEPKSDLVRDVVKLAEQLGIPKKKILVVDPTDAMNSIKFNPVAGPMEVAAETWRGTLDALAGDQDPFFKGQQSETAAQYVMLGKIRFGSQFNFIIHLQRMYAEPRFLADVTEEVRRWIDDNRANPAITMEERMLLERYDRVCTYFEMDVLEYMVMKDREGNQLPILYPTGHKYAGKQMVHNKKDKFITGAKKYVTDISMNAMLSSLLTAKEGEEFLDLDTFLSEGGILLFNSALAELEELSLMFGQFIIRQMQSAVFRRPPQENGYKRIPIFFTIDEFPLYINEAFARLLTLGRSYKVGTSIAIQNLGQLRVVENGYDEVILANASNKTVFGRGMLKDNEYFSAHFGESYVLEESMNESVSPINMPNPSRGLRHNTQRTLQARFTPTELKELPFKHFVVELVGRDQSIQEPIHAYGKFVNETKFLKRFLDIGSIELATRNYKPLSFKGNIRQLAYLVQQLDDKPAEQEEEAVEEAPAIQNDELDTTEAAQVAAAGSNEPEPVLIPVEGAYVELEDKAEPEEAGDLLVWSGSDETVEALPNRDALLDSFFPAEEQVEVTAALEPSASVEPSVVGSAAAAAEGEAAPSMEEREDDLPPAKAFTATHSVPDDVDSLIKSVHDNLTAKMKETDQQPRKAVSLEPQATVAAPATAVTPAAPAKPAAEQPKSDVFDLESALDEFAAVRPEKSKQQKYASDQLTQVDGYKEDL
ncbi:hypothetical protein J2T17_004402 [Paenibacillus mucilaginosus]|uniref:type IV secretory system conjugative DNA transfer family protein n=1 Tax=Paenibacillus mucilaginosus TaxID=61624 RepID=UPI003D19A520